MSNNSKSNNAQDANNVKVKRLAIEDVIRKNVIDLFLEGKNPSYIASFMKRPRTTVNSIIKKYKLTGSSLATRRGGT